MLSRPEVAEIMAYRNYVDTAMHSCMNDMQDSRLRDIVLLGINHEQQHQELILTDIKHAFSKNQRPPVIEYLAYAGKLREIGKNPEDCEFCFDNETPRHAVFIAPFKLASRPVINAEYLQFIEDGGYQNPLLWLADGWALIRRLGLSCPAYWYNLDDGWFEYTLAGLQPLNLNNPVCHINYFEACAFAAWAGKRLPTEFEWETAAAQHPAAGNILDMAVLHPPVPRRSSCTVMCGSGPAAPTPAIPALNPHKAHWENTTENSCAASTSCAAGPAPPREAISAPVTEIFFYPHSYWQFSGVRLAADN